MNQSESRPKNCMPCKVIGDSKGELQFWGDLPLPNEDWKVLFESNNFKDLFDYMASQIFNKG